MKKMMITLAVVFATLSSFAGETTVSQTVLESFKKEFVAATDVEWSAGEDYYKASFNYNGKYVMAYYSAGGELLGITRNLSALDLPVVLQNKLRKNYAGYWISNLAEVSKGEDTNYYITLENADTRIVLKSADNSWTSFQKEKKS